MFWRFDLIGERFKISEPISVAHSVDFKRTGSKGSSLPTCIGTHPMRLAQGSFYWRVGDVSASLMDFVRTNSKNFKQMWKDRSSTDLIVYSQKNIPWRGFDLLKNAIHLCRTSRRPPMRTVLVAIALFLTRLYDTALQQREGQSDRKAPGVRRRWGTMAAGWERK